MRSIDIAVPKLPLEAKYAADVRAKYLDASHCNDGSRRRDHLLLDKRAACPFEGRGYVGDSENIERFVQLVGILTLALFAKRDNAIERTVTFTIKGSERFGHEETFL
jgi:hypothetical protein